MDGIEDEVNQYLSFQSGNEFYGLPIDLIREVIEYTRVTPIPLINSSVHGVINLRGNVVTVIDLNSRLYNNNTAVTINSCIIITEYKDDGATVQVGLLIDNVNEVIDIPKNMIEEEPDFGVKIRPDFIKGVGKHAGKFILMLKLNNLLDIDELSCVKHFNEINRVVNG